MNIPTGGVKTVKLSGRRINALDINGQYTKLPREDGIDSGWEVVIDFWQSYVFRHRSSLDGHAVTEGLDMSSMIQTLTHFSVNPTDFKINNTKFIGVRKVKLHEVHIDAKRDRRCQRITFFCNEVRGKITLTPLQEYLKL